MNSAQILQMSPDEASSKNAKSLANAKNWQGLGAFDGDDGETLWGEIKGSSGETYHTRVGFDAATFDCSCPSRKRPCKHALALALLRDEDASVFKDSPPNWVVKDETPAPIYKSAAPAPPEKGEIMPLKLPASWQNAVGAELEKPYFAKLREFLEAERQNYTVYPPSGMEFAALEATPFDEVRVLILGQDPYHGPRQAHGMAFSVQTGITPPPSLQNIFAELQSEFGFAKPKSGYLMPWAKQGVLLLNTVLTVRRGEANSHKSKGWEKFTDAVIKAVSAKEERVVFVLWGASAQKKEKLIDTQKHAVVKSVHPSPLSAHLGFFGSAPFTQINVALKQAGRVEIDWNLN